MFVESMISIVGCGGHALSLMGCITDEQRMRIVNVVSKEKTGNKFFNNLTHFTSDKEFLSKFAPHTFILGVGAHPKTTTRENLFNTYQAHGYRCETVISNSACVNEEIQIGIGAQIFPGTIINVGSKIGCNTIVNTGAIIEHGAIVEDHCHIAPGAIILGDAKIRRGSFIGAGTVVFPNVEVGTRCIVAALQKISSDLPGYTFHRD